MSAGAQRANDLVRSIAKAFRDAPPGVTEATFPELFAWFLERDGRIPRAMHGQMARIVFVDCELFRDGRGALRCVRERLLTPRRAPPL